jgi:hypothetical protein
VPDDFIQYSYAAGGSIVDLDAAVEQVSLKFGDPVIKVVKTDRVTVGDQEYKRYLISLRVKYRISGLADISDRNGRKYLYPLPAIETHAFTGKPSQALSIVVPRGERPPSGPFISPTGADDEIRTASFPSASDFSGNVEAPIYRFRENGEFDTDEILIELREEDFNAGNLSWQASVKLYGYEAKLGPKLVIRPTNDICDDLTGTVWEAFAGGSVKDEWIFKSGKPGKDTVALLHLLDLGTTEEEKTYRGSFDGKKFSLRKHVYDPGAALEVQRNLGDTIVNMTLVDCHKIAVAQTWLDKSGNPQRGPGMTYELTR